MQDKRASNRVAYMISAGSVASCFFVLAARWLFIHWEDDQLFNFIVAFFPFVISVALAFIPDHKMNTRTRVIWRSVVIIAGIGYSLLLWHQQTLSQASAGRQQQKILNAAVEKSNNHSDAQTQTVRNDLKERTERLRDQFTSALSQGTLELNQHIEKAKPPVPGRAKLQFTFPIDTRDEAPKTEIYLPLQETPPRANGFVHVPFTFANVSDITALHPEIWLLICGDCSFAREPEGFERLAGESDQERHRNFPGNFNSGVSFVTMYVDVTPPTGIQSFQIGLRYACETCGKVSDVQNLVVFLY
jgi:hypothetical protein